jgi:hypothetical protein
MEELSDQLKGIEGALILLFDGQDPDEMVRLLRRTLPTILVADKKQTQALSRSLDDITYKAELLVKDTRPDNAPIGRLVMERLHNALTDISSHALYCRAMIATDQSRYFQR